MLLKCRSMSPPPLRSPSTDDDDLQSLEWLQNFDIGRFTNPQETDPDKELIENRAESTIESIDEDQTSDQSEAKEDDTFDQHQQQQQQQRRFHQCTFSCMIFRAIEQSQHRALPLPSIYEWIEQRYPSLCSGGGTQWKNSVRHSLSLNQCFIRLKLDAEDSTERTISNPSFSSWWTVHPDFRNAYGPSVLAQGAAHNCLPRGVNGVGLKKTPVKHLGTSEHELAVLANDIKTAATILSLTGKMGLNNGNRSSDGNRRKTNAGASCRKRKPELELAVSRDMAEDHRYLAEKNTRSTATSTRSVASLAVSSSASSAPPVKSPQAPPKTHDPPQPPPTATPAPAAVSTKPKPTTADACVQVCASDFNDNHRLFVNVRPKKRETEAPPASKRKCRRGRK